MRKHKLKAWDDPAWKRKLSRTVTVSRVDEAIPTDKLKRERKPWYIALTQQPDLLSEVGDVEGLPSGHTVLLSEYDVVALVRYLLEPQVAVGSDNPDRTEGATHVRLFLQPGMVEIAPSGEAFNGEAQWSPEYFTQQEQWDAVRARAAGETLPRLHTLPWKLKL